MPQVRHTRDTRHAPNEWFRRPDCGNTTLLLLAAAALSGCAVYRQYPVYETYPAPVMEPYGVVQPTYIYGGAV